jgi:hypothetical protein
MSLICETCHWKLSFQKAIHSLSSYQNGNYTSMKANKCNIQVLCLIIIAAKKLHISREHLGLYLGYTMFAFCLFFFFEAHLSSKNRESILFTLQTCLPLSTKRSHINIYVFIGSSTQERKL